MGPVRTSGLFLIIGWAALFRPIIMDLSPLEPTTACSMQGKGSTKEPPSRPGEGVVGFLEGGSKL